MPRDAARYIADIAEASQKKDGELHHWAFSECIATSQLGGTFEMDDPECEMCLENAKLAETKVVVDQLVCNDSYLQLQGIANTPSARLAQFKTDLKNKIKAEPWEGSIVEHFGDTNIEYFQNNGGMDLPDATGCIWALSFYTGNYSADTSRGASLKMRQGNLLLVGAAQKVEAEKRIDETRMATYYLTRALCAIPAYRGKVMRNVTFKDGDMKEYLETYARGNIVKWYQWASSKKVTGANTEGVFSDRNVEFQIWSISGRHIDDFSNFSARLENSEDEVLFMPGATFLVLGVHSKDGKHIIEMRQVELGMTKGFPLLWVDDLIWNDNMEMKGEVDNAQQLRSQDHVIKFILKPSTRLAMAFLRSEWGKQLILNKNLRIISDMGRPEEEDGYNAGANLIRQLEVKGVSCQIMIFTSDAEKGLEKLRSKGVKKSAEIALTYNKDAQNIQVTVKPLVAIKFASFDGVSSCQPGGCCVM